MYIVNGIAYAGTPSRGIEVSRARNVNDLLLLITFSTGETRLYDGTALLDVPAFKPLANPQVFADFVIDHGVITWLDGELDMAPEAMYEQSYPYEAPAIHEIVA